MNIVTYTHIVHALRRTLSLHAIIVTTIVSNRPGLYFISCSLMLLISTCYVVLSSDPMTAMMDPFFLQVSLMVIVYSLCISYVIYIGSDVNFVRQSHRAQLCQHAVCLQYKVNMKDINEVELQKSLNILEVIMNALKILDVAAPTKLFGIACNTSMAVSIISTVGFVYSTLIQYAITSQAAKV